MAAPSFLLIHGAWAGPWIWQTTAARLTEAGFSVAVADPLGQDAPLDTTFEAALARLVQAVDACAGPLCVVGHSGGGVMASALAEARPARVAMLVYVAGFMLPSGWNYSAIAARQPPGTGIGPHLVWDADRRASRVPVAAAKQVFFHDCPEAQAEAAATQLTAFPEAVRAAAPTLTAQRFGLVPRVYLECSADRSIPLAAQREMQRRVPGARRVTLPCGHAPMLAAPEALWAALIEMGQGLSPG